MVMYITLALVGFFAGALSGSIGFGGGMILLPVITWFYGVEVAVPVSTIAQLMSNLSRSVMGWKEIRWRETFRFLIAALPFTALGAFGFAVADKRLMTRALCVFLIVFAVIKLTGKIRLPKGRATMLAGGGLTGLLNGMLGISGPLSSAVFLTLDLSPVAYVASEASAAAAMHVVKAITYGKFALMDSRIFLNGLFIGCAMMAGNVLAMRLIKHIDKRPYRIMTGVMLIVTSVLLFITV